jgi:hypothetical protein
MISSNQRSRFAARPRFLLVTGVTAIGVALACSGERVMSTSRRVDAPQLLMNSSSCAVQYRSIINLSDTELDSAGIPSQTDTSDVCEAWTGSDYQVQDKLVGETMSEGDERDTSQIVEYINGQVTGYTASGVVTAEPSSVPGGTLADLVSATSEERAAVADDPYYGILASGSTCIDPNAPGCDPGGGGGGGGGGGCDHYDEYGNCCEPQEIICDGGGRAGLGIDPGSVVARVTTRLPNPSVASVPDDGKYKRHGLTRRGVRALLDTYERTGTTPAGLLHFQKSAGGGELTVDVEPRTQLIAHQEFRAADRETKIHYQWSRVRGTPNYVRRQLVVETTMMENGAVRSRGAVTMMIDRLRWDAARVP